MSLSELEIRRALGLEPAEVKVTAKCKIASRPKGWYVKMAVRKMKGGVVTGVIETFEAIIPTISSIDAEYRAKQEAQKKGLKFWTLLESCPAEEASCF